MKILIINKFHYLRGGCERHVFDLSEKLQQEGHEVVHFSMKDSRNLRCEDEKYFIEKVNFDKFSFKNIFKIFYNYDAVKKLNKLIREENPDVAHLHNIAHHFSPAIIRVLKKNKISIVQTLHDYKIICPNYRLYNKNGICEKCRGGKYFQCVLNKCLKDSYAKSFLVAIEAYLYRFLKIYDLVDLFIAPSNYMRDICVKFGMSSNKIKVLYNFVDDGFSLEDDNKNESYLLYFGRLSKEKGVDLLVGAMSKIKNTKLKLKIVGLGPMQKDIRDMVARLGMESRVEFLGFKSGRELASMVINAQAIIMPSIWPENMPYSLLEAMRTGKVVIVSNIGGMAELIENGKNGFLFKMGNIPDLVEKVDSLSKYDLEEIGENARNTVVDFSSDKYINKIMKEYKRISKL